MYIISKTDWLFDYITVQQHINTKRVIPHQNRWLWLQRQFKSLQSKNCIVWEHDRYQAKSEQNFWQDLIPRVRHGEAALMHPLSKTELHVQWSLRFKTMHSPNKIWSYIEGGLKIEVYIYWNQSINQSSLLAKHTWCLTKGTEIL